MHLALVLASNFGLLGLGAKPKTKHIAPVLASDLSTHSTLLALALGVKLHALCTRIAVLFNLLCTRDLGPFY